MMENLAVSQAELRIHSKEDEVVLDVANGSSVVSSSSSVFQRRIVFQPAKKPFAGFGNTGAGSDFRIETLNSDSGCKRPFGLNASQSGKKVDGSDFVENGLDPELGFGITFRKIGAGLENLGNTCFLNSVLQCLTYTEPLAAYLQSGKHQNSCHIAGFCALCAIQKHVSRALQSTGRSLVPKDLVSNLRCISRNFRNARQEDAHEYMVNLLESMHKCCLPSGVPSESPAAYEKSLVHKIFGGRLRSQVECQQCSYCSNKFDPFLDLSLEIVKADTLPVALRNFTAAELLDGGEKHYQCQRCKQKVRAKKRLTVHKAPYVLTVHLKRFHAHDPGRKYDKKVLFDRSLDMKPFVSGSYEGDLKYSLYGVLVHFGHSTHSGHYVCFVRTSSGIWYLLNDNEVRAVSEKTVLDQKAYMLFYVRDRKNIATRKPVDVVKKENVKPSVGSNITNLVFKQLSKENADNGLTVNGVLPAGSTHAVYKKDSVNSGTSKGIHENQALNGPAVSQCTVTKENPCAGTSGSPLLKDPSKVVSLKPDLLETLPPSEPSINSNSETAKVDNANVTAGAKSDCLQASKNTLAGNLGTNDTSEKLLNLGTMEVPILSLSVDSGEKMLNKIDYVKSPNKPSCESGQGECIASSSAAGNSFGDQAGDSVEQIGNEIVQSSSASVVPNESLQKKVPDSSPQQKLKKKLLKHGIPNMHLQKFFRASLGLRKKKKHKKSKRCTLETQYLIKEQLLESNCFSSEVGPSTSNASMLVSSDSTKSQRKKVKSRSKSRGNYLMDTAHERLEKRNEQNGDAVAMDRESKKSSFSTSETNQRDSSVLDRTESNKKDAVDNGMYMLTRGMEETTVACWDGIVWPTSQIVESSSIENIHIGYVPDEWDEEYDRGKRKKVRQNKHDFTGPNPFQEIASRKLEFKKAKMDRSSSGNKPFRI
ncbi:ubiquitin carboxyl-terminal hydrolase 23 isoform X2 [Jatropha curcas]|uniref:ubiquitin carboxyl-terminal hydrolase 23 isoform X2 n=1 Tax=Jatropha curcas TaxID=180498 RepID=UPI0009D73962|nr:ubiquitin carboxyl-terminal hydrolase 23 isoform X2 [Jatropha curcas]